MPSPIIKIIFLLAFFQGLLIILDVPSQLIRVTIEGFILINFFVIIFLGTKRSLPLIFVITAFIVSGYITIYFNGEGLQDLVMFQRNMILNYLFFITAYNSKNLLKNANDINKLIMGLFIFQIVATGIKFVLIGTDENYIGTMEINNGALNTVLPLFGTGFAFAYYYIVKKKRRYWLYIVGFALMAIIGNKRAFWFLVPILLFIEYYYIQSQIYGIRLKNVIAIPRLVAIVSVGVLFMLFGIKFSPSLNPENEIGGSIDSKFVINYITEYNTYETESSTYGRQATNKSVTQLMFIRSQPLNSLFGYGLKDMYGVSRSERKVEKKGLYNFGIMGNITGLAYHMITLGLIGAGLLIFLIILLYLKIRKLPMKKFSPQWQAIIVGLKMSFLVLAFDFIFYTKTFLYSYIPALVFFYLLGILLNKHRNNSYA